jgi:hypothetical protein
MIIWQLLASVLAVSDQGRRQRQIMKHEQAMNDSKTKICERAFNLVTDLPQLGADLAVDHLDIDCDLVSHFLSPSVLENIIRATASPQTTPAKRIRPDCRGSIVDANTPIRGRIASLRMLPDKLTARTSHQGVCQYELARRTCP